MVGQFGQRGAAAAPGAAPTFNKDVAPIFFANCTSCHRPGEIAPMSLMTYKDARPWAQVDRDARSPTARCRRGTPIRRTARSSNERRLTDAQKTTIAQWVSGRRARGQGRRPAGRAGLHRRLEHRQPDVVLSMQEDYPIPATGAVPYQYFEIPANFAEDRWIQAWEIRPGDRSRRAPHDRLLEGAEGVAEAQRSGSSRPC